MTTQLSARKSNAEVSGTKVGKETETGKSESERTLLLNSDGTVYGWTVGGKIYLNRNAMDPAAPIHEYTHLRDELRGPLKRNREVDINNERPAIGKPSEGGQPNRSVAALPMSMQKYKFRESPNIALTKVNERH